MIALLAQQRMAASGLVRLATTPQLRALAMGARTLLINVMLLLIPGMAIRTPQMAIRTPLLILLPRTTILGAENDLMFNF